MNSPYYVLNLVVSEPELSTLSGDNLANNSPKLSSNQSLPAASAFTWPTANRAAICRSEKGRGYKCKSGAGKSSSRSKAFTVESCPREVGFSKHVVSTSSDRTDLNHDLIFQPSISHHDLVSCCHGLTRSCRSLAGSRRGRSWQRTNQSQLTRWSRRAQAASIE